MGRFKQRFRKSLEKRSEYHGIPCASGNAGKDIYPEAVADTVILGVHDIIGDHARRKQHGKENNDRNRLAEPEVASGKRIRRHSGNHAGQQRSDPGLSKSHDVRPHHARSVMKRRLIGLRGKFLRDQAESLPRSQPALACEGGRNHQQKRDNETGAHHDKKQIQYHIKGPMLFFADICVIHAAPPKTWNCPERSS